MQTLSTNAKFPKTINLNLMSKEEFDNEMEKRYQEALNERVINAHEYFEQFKKRIKNV